MQEIVILLCAPTKYGKTTLSMSLMSDESREVLSQVSSERTNITIDWVYTPDAESIGVVSILLNTSNVYKFSASCTDADKKSLSAFEEFLGVSGLGLMSPTDIQKCADAYLTNNKENSIDVLVKLLNTEGIHNFIQRVRVTVAPSAAFTQVLCDRDVSLVLRDTRGFLDTEVTETHKTIQDRSAEELGLDGIDSAIILATATKTPNALADYKNSFGKVLEAVPVFCILRDPGVVHAYDYLFSDYTEECFEVFWTIVTNLRDKLRTPLKLKYIAYYDFLQLMGVGIREGNMFKYNYEVYDHTALEYFCSEFQEAYASSDPSELYQQDDYKLYSYLILSSIANILDMTLEHSKFKEYILSDDVMDEVKKYARQALYDANAQGSETFKLIACDRNPGRDGVCRNIMSANPILGKREGITTRYGKEVKYPGALGSAVATFAWLWKLVENLPDIGDSVGGKVDIAGRNMTNACRQNLIKMYLLDQIRKRADTKAVYLNNFMIDRKMIRDAINAVRREDKHELNDAVDNVALKLIDMLF